MRKMSQLIEMVGGVFYYMDDVLVFGKDQKEHGRRLETGMKIVEISDIRLKKDKWLFK